ncbi:MAG: VOC family protein, partial [Bacteroidales bacterium]
CFKDTNLNPFTQMTTASIYLLFNGNCREAFEYYRSVFGGEFESISTFGEMPPQEGRPPLPDDAKNRIMHVTLRLSESSVLMGSDDGGTIGPEVTVGNNFSIMLGTGSVEETDRIFNLLSEGGKVSMPLANTFWDSYFGMLTDRFGISWMVSCPVSAA